MSSAVVRFGRILHIELEDLEDHIRELARNVEAKRDGNLISEYVCRENLAVLRNEAACLHNLLQTRLLDGVLAESASVDDAVARLKQFLRAYINDCGFAECTLHYVCRKIDKVADYIRGSPSLALPVEPGAHAA